MRKISTLFITTAAVLSVGSLANAQNAMNCGNAQHTNVYPVSGQTLNSIHWTTPIDVSNSGTFAHYGQPLVTTGNTVLVPQLQSGTTFTINAYNGATGAFKYTLSSDYIYPAQDSWLVPFQPCVVGTRLYYPGAGGTLWYVDNIDTNSPTAPTRVCFYTLATYNSNTAGYNGCVFIDTPITADSHGNLFFGFRVQNTPVAPFTAGANGNVSGWARVSSTGSGTYVFVDAMTSDPVVTRDSHSLAPALSNDESTVYVVGKKFDTSYYAYLCGLDSTTLATKYKRFIQDPRPSGISAAVHESGTSCPLVAPDGDVYLGCFVNPYNGSRGFLAHYSGDLSTVKTPGAFGWDYTPGIVPASAVPSYHGTSSYLLFCKYNNYTGTGQDDGGDGVNTLAILDPNNETQIDWHPQAAGMVEMREVMTVIGNTPDTENPSVVLSTREWCVNATAVDSATKTVFFNSEDGNAYRWNLAQNSLSEVLNLTTGFGAPYVPQSIGPDGTIYTFNGTDMFAMGAVSGVTMKIDSSQPDNRLTVAGDSLTFTATVGGGAGTPTGTVTFTDKYFVDHSGNPVVTTLASNVPLVSGVASVTTSALPANLTGGNTIFGSHFITATYSGDGGHPGASITRIQKVHSNASSTAASASPSPSPYGQPVTLNATVSPVPAGSGTPTMMLSFVDQSNNNRSIGQGRLDGTGAISLTNSSLTPGTHNIVAVYNGDTQFASSTSSVSPVVVLGITNFTVSPSTGIRGGTPVTGTVTIAAAAPAGGEVVTISSNSPNATVPASVTVPQGQTTANFTINTTNPTTSTIPATITCTDGIAKIRTINILSDNESSFVSQSAPLNVGPGTSFSATLTFKNIGTVTWAPGAGYQIKSQNPAGNTNWGSATVAIPGSVAPNANMVLTHNFTAPATPGTYNFMWNMAQNNAGFGALSTNLKIVVSADAAQYISKTGPVTVNAGADFFVQNTMKNTGSNSWSGAAGYYMMTQSPANNLTWAINKMFLPGPGPFANGTTVTMTGKCTAPLTPGTYQMQWQMCKSGVAFGDKSPLLNISVVLGPDDAQFISQTGVPGTIAHGSTFTATINVKNLGTATWTSGTGYAIKSQNPAGNTNWGVSTINVPSNVAQNGTATFTHTFTAPSTPGTYQFQWRMAHNGTAFGQYTTNITVIVN